MDEFFIVLDLTDNPVCIEICITYCEAEMYRDRYIHKSQIEKPELIRIFKLNEC